MGTTKGPQEGVKAVGETADRDAVIKENTGLRDKIRKEETQLFEAGRKAFKEAAGNMENALKQNPNPLLAITHASYIDVVYRRLNTQEERLAFVQAFEQMIGPENFSTFIETNIRRGFESELRKLYRVTSVTRDLSPTRAGIIKHMKGNAPSYIAELIQNLPQFIQDSPACQVAFQKAKDVDNFAEILAPVKSAEAGAAEFRDASVEVQGYLKNTIGVESLGELFPKSGTHPQTDRALRTVFAIWDERFIEIKGEQVTENGFRDAARAYLKDIDIELYYNVVEHLFHNAVREVVSDAKTNYVPWLRDRIKEKMQENCLAGTFSYQKAFESFDLDAAIKAEQERLKK